MRRNQEIVDIIAAVQSTSHEFNCPSTNLSRQIPDALRNLALEGNFRSSGILIDQLSPRVGGWHLLLDARD